VERALTRRALRARRPNSELCSSQPRERERRSEPDLKQVDSLIVRRPHKRPRAAALLPPFRQTRIASSFKNLEEPSVEVPMLYSQSPPLTAEETSFDELARDPGVRSDPRMGRRRMKPSIDAPYSYRFGEGQPASGRPSIGRRMFRTLFRFSIAVLIGVGATLGWQSYGDEAKEMLVAQVPTLGLLLSVSTTKSPAGAATSTDTTRQLAPLASTLDAVRRSVEQLAARQEQMAQNIAALRAVEEDVRQKMSSAPSAPAQQAASIPQPKPPQAKIESRLPPPAGPLPSR
jgi:hypothetical protein